VKVPVLLCCVTFQKSIISCLNEYKFRLNLTRPSSDLIELLIISKDFHHGMIVGQVRRLGSERLLC